MELEQARKLGVCRICEQPFKNMDSQPTGWKDRFDCLVYPERVVLDYGTEFAHEACLPKREAEPQGPKYHRLNRWWRGSHNTYGHDGDCYYWGRRFCDCGLLNYLRYHSELQKHYPRYSDERFYHDNRVQLLLASLDDPKHNRLIQEWEARIQKMAMTYVETPCPECQEPMLEYATENPDGEGLVPISQLFKGIFSNYHSLCKSCDKS